MSHEMFKIAITSQETLKSIVLIGVTGVLVFLLLVGFFVRRGKRRALEKPAAPKQRRRRHRKSR